MTRFKVFAFKLVVILSSIVITMLALEAWLAIAQMNTKSYDRYIPGKGGTYMPGAYYRHTKEGFSEGYINSHGFRDYERTYEKQPNTFRIVILGDSYVEALQLALRDTFPALLEKKLNENSDSIKFEVLNLGQSGYGTADEYMRYLNFGVKYSPDLVILAFLTGNDFQDNSKFLSRENITFYFVFDEHGNLVLDRSLFDEYERSLTFGKRLFQTIKRESYLANLVSERLYLLRFQIRDYSFRRSFLRDEQSGGSREAVDEFSPLNIYLNKMTDRWKEAFAITTGILRQFRNSVESNGSRFVLVSLSNAEQVHPEVQQELNEKYGPAFDFEQPDRIIEEFAKKEHINYLKLMSGFREYHLRTGKYLHGFSGSKRGHWNENGHRLAAEKIFDFLKDQHLLPLDTRKDLSTHMLDGRKSVPLSLIGNNQQQTALQ
jgi:lysophospholipase L1-like esterase